MKTGIELIQDERNRQVDVEGWTPGHDDEHLNGELAGAASCYAKMAQLISIDEWEFEYASEMASRGWPWARKWWKPHADAQRNLEKSGALIASEIDRLSRLNNP